MPARKLRKPAIWVPNGGLSGLLRTPEELLKDLAFWIDGYYNPERRHSSIGYYSPIAFENRTQISANVTLRVA